MAVRASAGAVNYVPVARVVNIGATIDKLKEKGIWFVCADMGGKVMYDLDLKGPIGLVVGSEGEGAGRLVKEKCDFTAAIPMKGAIDSLNASVAAGVHDVIAKSKGSSNPHNLVKATVAALCEMRDAYTVAGLRGIPMERVFNG